MIAKYRKNVNKWYSNIIMVVNHKYIQLSVFIAVLLIVFPLQVHGQIDTWRQTAGPEGGVVNAMMVINDKPIATLYSGGIYTLQDSTQYSTWAEIGINHGLPENRSFDIVVDPENTNTLYAGLMLTCGARSFDAGATWEGLCDSILETIVADNFSGDVLAFDPNDNTALYLAGRASDGKRYVLKTFNQGTTWEIVTTFNEEYFFNDLVFYNDALYLALRSGGVLRSADNGETWTNFSEGITETGVIQFAIDEINGQLYMAGGLYQFNVRQGGNVYVLNEATSQWDIVQESIKATTVQFYNNQLWIGTEDGYVWEGDSPLNLDNPLPHYVAGLAFTSHGIYAGVAGYGMYRSLDNGVHWSKFNEGLYSMAIREIALEPNKGKSVYALTWDRFGLFSSQNGGKSYKIIGKQHYYLTMAVDPKNFNRLFLGGPHSFYEARVKKQKMIITERTAPGPTDSEIQAIAIHPTQSATLLVGVSQVVESTTGYGIYRSTNNGESWKRVKGIPSRGVYSIIFHPTKPKIVYAAVFGSGVYKSTNGGKRFKKIGGDQLKYTYRLTLYERDPNIIVASSHLFFAGLSTADQISGEYGGIFKTTNGGKSWNEITADIRTYGDNWQGSEEEFQGWLYNFGHLPNYEMILFHPKDPNIMLVGHHGENIVLTTDNGNTWSKPVNGMIPDAMHNYAYCMGATKNFKKIVACTCGRGIFNGTFSDAQQSIQWYNETDNLNITIPSTFTVRTPLEARSHVMSEDLEHDHSMLISNPL